jgi:hypothetical protein
MRKCPFPMSASCFLFFILFPPCTVIYDHSLLDRVDTHVISSIFHIDRHYDSEDEPWCIEIEGHDGKRHSANLKPGQMLLYESAKCPHGRSTALKGDWYAAIFSHFKPSEEVWHYSQQDIWLAVPPGWDAPPISMSGEGRWAGAFLTHDSSKRLLFRHTFACLFASLSTFFYHRCISVDTTTLYNHNIICPHMQWKWWGWLIEVKRNSQHDAQLSSRLL